MFILPESQLKFWNGFFLYFFWTGLTGFSGFIFILCFRKKSERNKEYSIACGEFNAIQGRHKSVWKYYSIVNVINLTSTFRGSGFPATKRSRPKAVIA
jgi:hypothetical protein